MSKSIVLASLFLAAIPSGWSQTITGSITGTVTDPAGAVVPNATVTAKNINTNLTSEAKTNSAGVYNILFLPVGPYSVTVQATGFKTATVPSLTLSVNQTARVDMTMEVGAVTESINVTEGAPIIQTESTQTGEVISSTQATQLPLNGRNFVSLTLLVPGSITPYPNAFNSP